MNEVSNMSDAWYQSRFTGLFRDFQQVAPRPYDPQVSICAGIVPRLHPEQTSVWHVGGCGWSDDAAAAACVGEGIERLFAYPTAQDAAIEASYEKWPLDEPAIAPAQAIKSTTTTAAIRINKGLRNAWRRRVNPA